ncbi:MAG TPA: DedA family protein [Gaiellaceae bacterium]|jgi:membrane protein DedA with SNARE-associated domain|nr:DedA family protein [Gaiellaceae bacterium]
MPIADVTSSITTFIGDHGLYAVFGLMVLAAVIPVASELTMLYAGALASGAFANAHVIAFGHQIDSHAWAYVAVSVTGLLGNLVGATIGWWIGSYGTTGLERHGRLLHVTPARLERAERWFARFGGVAVPVGFVTPGVRSFVAIPAGLARVPYGRFLPLAAFGCGVFCFGLAAIGWAFGSSYDSVHRFLDYIAVAALLVLVVYGVLRWRSTRLPRRAPDSPR